MRRLTGRRMRFWIRRALSCHNMRQYSDPVRAGAARALTNGSPLRRCGAAVMAAARLNQQIEDFVLNIFRASVALASVVWVVGPANAETASAADFPIAGTYMQNVACKGDGSDNVVLKVVITPKEIDSNSGVCTILDNKKDGAAFKLHVECKFPAGPMVGDLTFTPMPDKTIKFVDRDNTYHGVLHRCPN